MIYIWYTLLDRAICLARGHRRCTCIGPLHCHRCGVDL